MAQLHDILDKILEESRYDFLYQVADAVYNPATRKLNSHAGKKTWWQQHNLAHLYKELMQRTSFLDSSATLTARLYSIIHDLADVPRCTVCNEPVHFTGTKTPPQMCKFHSVRSSTVKTKRAQTSLARYGTENYSSTKQCRERVETTNFAKYGVANPMQVDAVKQQVKNTNLARYGVDNFAKHHDFVRKVNQTCQSKHGVDHPMQVDAVKQQVKNTNLARYGVDNPSKSGPIKRKINIANFSDQLQTINQLANRDSVLLEIWNQHGRNWFKHHGASDSWILQTFSKLGIDFSNSSLPEDIIERHLVDLGVKYTRNDRTLIKSEIGNPAELDFYLPEFNLAIEVNGLYWHTEKYQKGKQYHLSKTQQCEQLGIQLIHILDTQVLEKTNIVLSRLGNLLGKSTRYQARKCKIRILSHQEKKQFFNQSHIQGDASSKINIGLVIADGTLIAAMSFSLARYSKSAQWELIRYSSLPGTTVVGGASRLFDWFRKTHVPHSVVSYSDRTWSSRVPGTVYEKLGFEYSHDSAPNYWYTRDNRTLHSRIKFQKHKLKDRLPIFDSELTEYENMVANSWTRYWDCGNSVWVYKNVRKND